MSEGSIKKVESTTDAETNVRDGHSNLSVLSNLETDDMDEEDDEDDEDGDKADDFSPPLFIQFSLAISQDKEDIVCAPVKHLPTCLAEIFQDESIPDAEQELDIDSLGKLDWSYCYEHNSTILGTLEVTGSWPGWTGTWHPWDFFFKDTSYFMFPKILIYCIDNGSVTSRVPSYKVVSFYL